MNVLFVCRQNIGRSQMAAALYNQMHADSHADSAGTVVDIPGQTLQAADAKRTIAAMRELGLEVAKNIRTQLTPAMLGEYDVVIVMAEPENTPEWLRNYPKTHIWHIEDTKNMDLAQTRIMRDVIKQRVTEL